MSKFGEPKRSIAIMIDLYKLDGSTQMMIELSADAARFVDSQIKMGRYPSAQAAIDAAVVRLQSEPFADDEIDELRSLVAVGLAEGDRGDFVDSSAEEVIADRRATFARRQAER